MEEWRQIPGFEGLYEVSDQGRVRRMERESKRGYTLAPKILKQSMSLGYPYVGMTNKDGKQFSKRVHTLVAAAFLGERPEGMTINHIDFDKTNNHVSNLEYVTHRENVQHSARHARHSGQFTMEQVQALRSLAMRDPGLDLEFIAKRLDVSVQTLCSILDARSYSLVPNKDGSLPTPILYTYRKTVCIDDIQDFVALGLSIPQVSKYYNVDYSTPYQMLRRAGIHQPGYSAAADD